jgi:hypothetical protein
MWGAGVAARPVREFALVKLPLVGADDDLSHVINALRLRHPVWV